MHADMHVTLFGVHLWQGCVSVAFAGVNKCVVKKLENVAEYDPHMKAGVPARSAAPVCGSQSLRPGDLFSVMQVGTVGVIEPSFPKQVSEDSVDRRASVHHAALVLVRPKDGSAQRFEVLTAQTMSL